jgi:hypothetical protein
VLLAAELRPIGKPRAVKLDQVARCADSGI